jgi:hypothetical protein
VSLRELMDGVGDTYPGSKEVRGPAAPIVHDEPEGPNLGHGTILLVNGRDVEFFYVGHLAAMLNRKPGTMRGWETEGILPPSGYTKPGKDRNPHGRRRLWTRAQLEGIWEIARDEGVLLPNSRVNVADTNFTARVRALFKALKEGS